MLLYHSRGRIMIYVPRSYLIEPNRVILYRWKAYRNHSKAHLMPRYAGSIYCRIGAVKHVIGFVWMLLGMGGRK